MNSTDPGTTLTRPDTVLFDLDGTLVDSGPTILAALRKAFAEEGLPPLPPEVEPTLLGPPFYRALPPLIGDDAERVTQTYRRIYVTEGFAYRAEPYPGTEALLDGLARLDVRLAVATSKLETSAVAVLEHVGLAGRFATVCGDTPDEGRPSKSAIIAEALRRIGRSPEMAMVGDRRYDVAGAIDQGLPCIGAGWGYGEPGELEAAGALAVMSTPAALAAAWRLA
ncbi:MAG: HAD hydrolase-like protein [Actinobacteria bacterium]|nr:HAD hydrolase-like protein [Actinomycetota bacterium]